MIWDDEDPRQIALIARGEDLYSFPDTEVWFGPLRTSTHVLGGHNWTLRMRQRTPKHAVLTRPRVSLHPQDDQNFGFHFKFRARRPYRSAEEVFEDIRTFPAAQRFSVTKFETKYVPVTDQKLADQVAFLEEERKRLREELHLMTLNEKRMIESDTDIELYEQNKELKKRLEEYERDPFLLLQKWTDERVASMDFSERKRRRVPDNVIDFVDAVRAKKLAVDEKLEEKIREAMR